MRTIGQLKLPHTNKRINTHSTTAIIERVDTEYTKRIHDNVIQKLEYRIYFLTFRQQWFLQIIRARLPVPCRHRTAERRTGHGWLVNVLEQGNRVSIRRSWSARYRRNIPRLCPQKSTNIRARMPGTTNRVTSLVKNQSVSLPTGRKQAFLY